MEPTRWPASLNLFSGVSSLNQIPFSIAGLLVSLQGVVVFLATMNLIPRRTAR